MKWGRPHSPRTDTKIPPADRRETQAVLQSSGSVGPRLRVDFLASSDTLLDVGCSPTNGQLDVYRPGARSLSSCASALISIGAPAYTVVTSSNVSNRLANFGRNFSASSAHAVGSSEILNQPQRSVSLLIFFSHNTEVDSWILKLNFKILINLK